MPDRDRCVALDRDDPLAGRRDRFDLPAGVIYLAGNSLGPPSADAPERLARFAREQWGAHLVGGWTADGWIELPRRLGARIAPLVGADADEVVVCDSTSVNLFKLLHAACDLRPDRPVIAAAADDFPTDRYLVDAVAAQRGRTVRRLDPLRVTAAELADSAVLVCSHVHYRTGRLYDMRSLTAAAHAGGALALWDVSHSVGALPLQLDVCAVDLAVGCTYKFLNGGPGAPALAFVARHAQEAMANPIAGWLGHAEPFAFAPAYRPAAGVGRLVAGTPDVAAMVCLDTALDVFDELDLAAARAKATALTDLFVQLIRGRLGDAFAVVSPREAQMRGSQVSLAHRDAYPIVQALIARGVVGDFRAPDVLRFGFAPLYLRHVDVFDAVSALADVMRAEDWRNPRYTRRAAVT